MKVKRHHLTTQRKQDKDEQKIQTLTHYKSDELKLKLPQKFSQYILQDYTFLQDYELLESQLNQENIFIAKIRDTQQIVKFKKVQFLPINTIKGLSIYKRFQALVALFQKGNILADNIFILKQNSKYFYYVIQPYLTRNVQDNFITLQQYILQNRNNLIHFDAKFEIFIKCKILLENLSHFQASYCGLNSKKILVDDQGNFYLMPFQLDISIQNSPYNRSYFPPEILKMIQKNEFVQNVSFLKWDIWSFGCITLEIFLYLTPYFLSTSIESQIKKSQNCTTQILLRFQQEFLELLNQKNDETTSQNSNSICSIQQKINGKKQKQKIQKVMNFLLNAFNKEEKKRNLLFEVAKQSQTNQKILIKQHQISSKEKKTQRQSSNKIMIKNKQISKKYTPIQSDDNYTELNVCQCFEQNSQGEYIFQLRFISLTTSIPKFNKSLKVTIKFRQSLIYQFYLDKNQKTLKKQNNNVSIHKKITIRNKSIQFFQKILKDDIKITFNYQLTSQSQQSLLYINLKTLTLMDNDKRVWKKPIQGSYEVKDGEFQGYRLKIKCEVKDHRKQKTQSNQEQHALCFQSNTVQSRQFQKDILSQKQMNNIQKCTLKEKDKINKCLSETSNLPQKKTYKKFSKFYEINNKIDQISSYWKSKSIENSKYQTQEKNNQNKQNLILQKIQKALQLK